MSIATGTVGGETRIRFAGVGFDVLRVADPRDSAADYGPDGV